MSATNNSKSFGAINADNSIRKCDASGCGHFGASRGERGHNGVDFIVTEGQAIKVPFDCKVTRHGYPYAGDTNYELVEIQGMNGFEAFKAKIMYVKNIKPVGTLLKKGEAVCEAANIAKRYSKPMTIHVHFELYLNGVLVDPTPFFS
ncbi:MAG: peptidoglycan DD-metalloendopeptidase family protein [Aequorivita sp.]|nr:peptidoglycan DD-metalloendopeptidase family protein [Aequorivita sp.]